MWATIVTGVVGAVLENSLLKGAETIVNKRKKSTFKKTITKEIEELLHKYEYSSLACGAFFDYIHSLKFSNFLYTFFYLSYDGAPTSKLIDNYVADVQSSAPSCKEQDVRDFFNSFEKFFKNSLHDLVNENMELAALWSLISQNNRKFYQRIFESEENLKRYMDSLFNHNNLENSPDLQKYHEICVKEFSKICFTGIAGAETKDSKSIDDLYVENHFMIIDNEITHKFNIDTFAKRNEVSNERESCFYLKHLSELFRLSKRIVLVGGAGYGKTTTVNYLFCKYVELYGEDILRIRINLKDYVSQIENNKAILDCLSDEVAKRMTFSKSSKVKPTIAEYLENGNALVIFDALDEIPSEALREKTRCEISRFTEVYYLSKYIITSREIGYLRNKFEDDFLHIRICPFNNEQIKKYAKLWYTLRQSVDLGEADFKVFYKHFSDEVKRSKCFEIIQNPIILVLALIIFDAENSLPHKRVEFYKKCIDTFLNTREERKGAYIFTEKARCILGDNSVIPKVAFYRYESIEKNQDFKLTKAELDKAIFNALEISNKSSWIDAVNIFTKYLIERTELVREVDEDTYDFSHKTFGEYFLSCYFSSNLENNVLTQLISNWIGDSNKDELARLVVEVVIQQNQSQQHNAVITMLLNSIVSITDELTKTYNHNKYDELSNKLNSFLHVMFEILRSGMLIPKFSDMFYQCLIVNPYLLRRTRSSRSTLNHLETEPCPIDKEHYINLSACRYSSDKNVVSLVQRYYSFVKVSSTELLVMDVNDSDVFLEKHDIEEKLLSMLILLKIVLLKREHILNKSKIDSSSILIIKSALKEYEELYESQEVFLSIIYLLCERIIEIDNIEESILAKFMLKRSSELSAISSFFTYISLPAKSFLNSKWFILSLNFLSFCVGTSFVYIIDLLEGYDVLYLMKNNDEQEAKKMFDLAKENSNKFKSILSCSTYNAFQSELINEDIFDEKYIESYHRCFDSLLKFSIDNTEREISE